MASRWAIALVAVVSLCQYRITILVHGSHFAQLVEAMRGVVTGNPHWRVYQNRVLGPYALDLADRLSGLGLDLLFLLAMMVLPLAQNLLFFVLVRRLTGDTKTSLAYTLFFALAFVLLLDSSWLFLWDYIDLLVFTAFGYGVLARRGNGYFMLLFAVGVFNRESALFIGVWLVLDGMIDGTRPGRLRVGIRDGRQVALGVALVALGVVIVEVLRRALFITSAGTRAGIEQVPLGLLGVTRLGHNLTTMMDGIFSPGLFLDLPVVVCVVLLPVWLLSCLRRCHRSSIALAATVLLGWSATLVVGLVLETRVYLWLLPQVLLLHVGLSGRVVPDTQK